MIQKEVALLNRLGLHIRPAAQLTKIAAKYKADVYLLKDGMRVNGKSIMGVMMLAAARGSTLTIECVGDDEQSLLDELVILFENKFYEE
ncbi:MAG: HPr family phosphocarrier protein [bacterium]|nr:HPr family phosphocarrier protein [bacterium]